jgi:hypothetical protein
VFPLILCFTAQRLENLDVRRRLAILVAFLVGTAATLTDYALEMHDRITTMFLGYCRQSYTTETDNYRPALRATARRYAAIGKALITAVRVRPRPIFPKSEELFS